MPLKSAAQGGAVFLSAETSMKYQYQSVGGRSNEAATPQSRQPAEAASAGRSAIVLLCWALSLVGAALSLTFVAAYVHQAPDPRTLKDLVLLIPVLVWCVLAAMAHGWRIGRRTQGLALLPACAIVSVPATFFFYGSVLSI